MLGVVRRRLASGGGGSSSASVMGSLRAFRFRLFFVVLCGLAILGGGGFLIGRRALFVFAEFGTVAAEIQICGVGAEGCSGCG